MGERKLEDPNVEGFHVVSNIAKLFWNSSKHEFVNGTNGTDSFQGGFMVWPVAVAVQSVVDAARINKNYVGLLEEVMTTLDKYYNNNTKGFSPTQGGDEFYADDSAQVVLCYITAYEVTQDKKYLDRAVDATKFLMGMADKKVGGVKWKTGNNGPNTVSTAECGMAAALLAKYVEPNDLYIQFGDYCFNFLFNKMLDKNGLMADGLEGEEAKLNPMKWTYNQGTPLTLCAHMFELTKDEKYFKAAHGLASAVTNTNQEIFDRDTNNHDVRFYRDSLKFYQLLVAGFADYLLVFGDRDHELSQKIVEIVNRHLYLVYTLMVFPSGNAEYHGTLSVFNIDKARNEAFNKMTGENKKCEGCSDEHENGDKKKKFAPSLMSMGAAARVFFQSARITPQVNF